MSGTARIPARLVCPGCRKHVTGTPVDAPAGAYRMHAHNRPRDAEVYPGQTCEESPIVRADRVEYASS